MLIFSGFESTFSVFTHQVFDYNERQNSLLFFYTGILALIIQGGIVRRPFKNLPLAITIGLVLGGISFLLIGNSVHLVWLLAGLVFLSVSISLINTHLPAMLTQTVSEENTGTAMGLFESVSSLSRIIGPLYAYLSIYHHFAIGYSICGLVLWGSIGLVYLYRRQGDV